MAASASSTTWRQPVRHRRRGDFRYPQMAFLRRAAERHNSPRSSAAKRWAGPSYARSRSPLRQAQTPHSKTIAHLGSVDLFIRGYRQFLDPAFRLRPSADVRTFTGSACRVVPRAPDAGLPPGGFSIDTRVTTGETALKLEDLQLAIGEATATGVLDVQFRPARSRAWKARSPSTGSTSTAAPDNAEPAQEDGRGWQMAQALVGGWRPGCPAVVPRKSWPVRCTDRCRCRGDDRRKPGFARHRRQHLCEWQAERPRRATRKRGGQGGKLQMNLKDADFAAVLDSFGLKGPCRPAGRSQRRSCHRPPLWETGIADVFGRLDYSAHQRQARRFRRSRLHRPRAQGGILLPVAGKRRQRSSPDGRHRGDLRQRHRAAGPAAFVGPAGNISVTGVIPYRSGSLALAGTLAGPDAGKEPLQFFIGGSWPNAVISPLSVLLSPQ